MKKNIKILYSLKIIILTALFSAALYFENCQQQRLIVMTAIFVVYLAVGFFRYFFKNESNLYFISFIFDIALVYILEFNSRLLVNYFFHSFYIIILLEVVMFLNMKKVIIIGTISVLVSMIKYIYLIYYKFNLSNVSQMAFFFMINALILVIAGFAQYNKEEREKKDILYNELLDVYKKLKEYNNEVKRLSVVEERNRIAREIHDSLGHNMTALIMQLQMVDYFLKEDGPKAEELLLNSIKTAKNSLSGIREVVETLRVDDSAKSLQQYTLRNLIDEFSHKTGADIKLTVTGENCVYNYSARADLYRIIQEAMTNAIRHGNATAINVTINYTDETISFSVRDNGIGVDIVKEGFGLKGIRERVEAFNGKVEYISKEGFIIKGFLYLEGKDDKSTVS